jgi:hypothetical protein
MGWWYDLQKIFACMIITSLIIIGSIPTPTHARPPTSSANPTIVQQGLTIHEIDKELARLKEQQKEMNNEISTNEQALQRQEIIVKERAKAAGKVLRTYYIGQRDALWLYIFRMNSLTEALHFLNYLSTIVRNDYRILASYLEAIKNQQALIKQLAQSQSEIVKLISEYESQRERLVKLQVKLDQQLRALDSTEQAKQLQQIKQATTEWETEGYPLFEQILSSLSVAILDLPKFLTSRAKLRIKGKQLQVTMTQNDFNLFLREQNDLFEVVIFEFKPQGINIQGRVNNKPALLFGNYAIKNEPTNAMKFIISSISFNQLILPDTTSQQLEEQFNLRFYPNKILSSLQVTEIQNEEGLLIIKFTFDGLPSFLGTSNKQ